MDERDRLTLMGDSWLSELPPDRRDALMRSGKAVRIANQANVYATGDTSNGLWAVLEGQVRLKHYPVPGIESLALALTPGSWFGEMSTIDGGPRPHDAIAHGSVRLLHVPMAAFLRIAGEIPLLYHDLGKLVCRHERIALEFITQMSMPLRSRIARLLLTRTSPDTPDLNLRQEDLAFMLGVSRQTMNRHLWDLAGAGIICLKYRNIRVVQRPALAIRAEMHDEFPRQKPP